MRIAVAKEIKTHEYRVGMTPYCAEEYVRAGHSVTVQVGAGDGAGYTDDEYLAAGASLESDVRRLFDEADMIVKVKEPQASEIPYFHKGQILYTYLHLAAERALTDGLMAAGVTAIAYETIQTDDRALPCLKPMSEIAGRLSVQEGAKYLEKAFGGRGILLGGVPGVRRGKVVILGGGVAGINAAKMAVGIGADVSVLDINHQRLGYIDDVFGSTLMTLFSNRKNIVDSLREADVVIGALLIPGAKTPRLVSREDLGLMKPGAVLVDVSIDQGGTFESSRPTSHDQPIYTEGGVVHYCVTNMPGAVALTSTLALTNQTLFYGLEIANSGVAGACKRLPALRHGLNIVNGHLTCPPVAQAHDLPLTPVDTALAG